MPCFAVEHMVLTTATCALLPPAPSDAAGQLHRVPECVTEYGADGAIGDEQLFLLSALRQRGVHDFGPIPIQHGSDGFFLDMNEHTFLICGQFVIRRGLAKTNRPTGRKEVRQP